MTSPSGSKEENEALHQVSSTPMVTPSPPGCDTILDKNATLCDFSEASSSSTHGASTNSSTASDTDLHPGPGAGGVLSSRVVQIPARLRNTVSKDDRLMVGQHRQGYNVPVQVQDYGSSVLAKARLRVHLASASMFWKGEDRHSVVVLDTVIQQHRRGNENDDDSSSPQLQVYAGVHDGHDGPEAAKYCEMGLLPHILLEMNEHESRKVAQPSTSLRRLFRRNSQRGSGCSSRRSNIRVHNGSLDDPTEDSANTVTASRDHLSRLEPYFCRAFEKAQDQFTATGTPPTFSDVRKAIFTTEQRPTAIRSKDPEQAPTTRNRRRLSKMFWRAFQKDRSENKIKPRAGGTTACTISIVSTHVMRQLVSARSIYICHCELTKVTLHLLLSLFHSFRTSTATMNLHRRPLPSSPTAEIRDSCPTTAAASFAK